MSAVDMLNKVRIMATLIGDRRVGLYEIDVEVHGGAVTLRGTVESEEQKRIAEDLTRELQVVNAIDNELEVEPETALLTDSIKKKIAEDGRITSKNVDVTVEDGVAHLTGVVDSVEEYYLVQETVESVEGVKSVKNDLEIEEGHTGHKCNCGRM